MDALPVTVDLPEDLAGEVSAYAEVACGWQVIRPSTALPPALALAERVVPGVPTVVLLRRSDPEAVRSCLLDGALDVLVWPGERARLPDIAPRLPAEHPHAPVLRVTGSAGGVGTSTVALALGGLVAWNGSPALVVGAADLCRLCGVEPTSAVAGGGPALGAAVPIEGVPQLTVLPGRVGVGGIGVHQGVVIADDGVGGTAGILVGRPDRALVEALSRHDGWRAVVVVGDGALPARALSRIGRGLRVVRLPWSIRVARAGLRGRVPSGLPGAALDLLRPLLTRRTEVPG